MKVPKIPIDARGTGRLTHDTKRNQPRFPTHFMSVDVEDYFQVEAFAGSVARDSWEQWPSRVVDNTRKILDLFDEYQTLGTFFFVGWIAEKFPFLVREVQDRGHELACHSYWHRPVYRLTPGEFREDTRRARNVIEQAGGAPVLGYRAPTWSITKDCLWALDILAEEGFLYDSSIYPIHHDLYGVPNAQRFPYRHSCANGLELREFPPATIQCLGVNFPVAGGGYLRIFPWFYTKWAIRHIEKEHGQPIVIYFHPWELDPDQPRIREKFRSRFRHYTNLRQMEQRLKSLLRIRSFQPFRDVLDREGEREAAQVESETRPLWTREPRRRVKNAVHG